jgi:hypothetical protein
MILDNGFKFRLMHKKVSVVTVILVWLAFVGGAVFSLLCVFVIQWLGIAKLVGLLGVR